MRSTEWQRRWHTAGKWVSRHHICLLKAVHRNIRRQNLRWSRRCFVRWSSQCGTLSSSPPTRCHKVHISGFLLGLKYTVSGYISMLWQIFNLKYTCNLKYSYNIKSSYNCLEMTTQIHLTACSSISRIQCADQHTSWEESEGEKDWWLSTASTTNCPRSVSSLATSPLTWEGGTPGKLWSEAAGVIGVTAKDTDEDLRRSCSCTVLPLTVNSRHLH